jgi:glycosyltransferase involved in cell wall biosynthesis
MPATDGTQVRAVLEPGPGVGAGRWVRRWAERLQPLDGGVNPSTTTVAVARDPAAVERRRRTVWWLDGDVLARRRMPWRAVPSIPLEVHRILITSEHARSRLVGLFPDRVDDLILTDDVSLVDLARASAPIPGAQRPMNIVIAGHDFRFIEPVARDLAAAGHAITWDRWTDGSNHDPYKSSWLLESADVVLCEWALGNAVWYSTRIKPGQRLIVRLHRYELDRPFGPDIDQERVDCFITVSDFIAQEAIQRFGWDPAKVTVLPNGVDHIAMRRPKHPGAEKALGLVGYGTPLKRFDLALDLLAGLRQVDPGYSLRVKGKTPEEMPWVWNHRPDREFCLEQRSRIEKDPLLRGAVDIDGYTPGLAEWLRGVGVILSLSDVESFHLALAEGMASGAAPVVLSRRGAEQLWGERWICGDVDEAVARILEWGAGSGLRAEGAEASRWVAERYDQSDVSALWGRLIAGD